LGIELCFSELQSREESSLFVLRLEENSLVVLRLEENSESPYFDEQHSRE
jgi:hypothetical protein